MGLPPSQEAIVAVLQGAPDGLHLREVAERIELSPPSALRNLRILEKEGLVAKSGRFHDSRYHLASHVSTRWADRLGAETAPVPIYVEWRSEIPVDWRFPLVARVPDRPAQETLYRFLDHAYRRGYFTPWLRRDGFPADLGELTADPGKLEARFFHETGHGPFSIVTYGSCARGDARPGSDLDLALVFDQLCHDDAPSLYGHLWESIAYDMAPGAARPVQLRITDHEGMRAPGFRHLADEIVADGITVYASHPSAPWVEVMRRSDRRGEGPA